jgi:hypothetical protein
MKRKKYDLPTMQVVEVKQQMQLLDNDELTQSLKD